MNPIVRKAQTVSLEAGYGFALNKSFGLEAAKYTWIFQPQAQVYLDGRRSSCAHRSQWLTY